MSLRELKTFFFTFYPAQPVPKKEDGKTRYAPRPCIPCIEENLEMTLCAIDLRTPLHVAIDKNKSTSWAVCPVLGFTLGVTTRQYNLAISNAN